MVDFKKSFDILMGVEFSSPSDALEYNQTEDGYTYMGIYEVAHPTWEGWEIIKEVLHVIGDKKEASKFLHGKPELTEKVKEFYKKEFWDKAKLDEVKSQDIADEIFIFGVNVGMKRAITVAQDLVGVMADGIVGRVTISALNNINVAWFDLYYDLREQEYYEYLVKKNPAKKIFAKGWRNRSLIV